MDISNYLIDFLNKKRIVGYNKYVELCEDILDQKKIDGLDGYPRELLAIELEKMIMMCIEQNRLSHNYPSYFKTLKLKEPLIYQNGNVLKNYIRLFIAKRDELKTNKDLEIIENFYNTIIEKYSKMPINRVITLPSGSKTNMNDMISAVGKLFDDKKLQTPSLFIKKTEKKAKKAAAIGTLVGTIGLSLIIHGYANPKEPEKKDNEVKTESQDETWVVIPDNEYVVSESDFVLPSIGAPIPGSFPIDIDEINKNLEPIETVESVEDIVTQDDKNEIQFQGYRIDVGDEQKNKEIAEKQKYLFELCQEQGVDFNNAMTIWHVESDGNFNCNGVKNSTNDYGEMQINECNLQSLNNTLHFVVAPEGEKPNINDIRNVFQYDWRNNMKAAVYLIKEREAMYNKGEYSKVFGCYNGWKGWESKPISIQYSKKATELRETLYNKPIEELFIQENVMEAENGRSL